MCRQGYVNGEWIGAKDNKVFSVLNPATKEEIARVADMGADDTKAAIRAANEAWAPWRRRAPKVSCVLRKQHLPETPLIASVPPANNSMPPPYLETGAFTNASSVV